MTRDEAKKEIDDLVRDIGRHDRLYHGDDAPEIDDAAYDALRHRLEELEARFPDLLRDDSPSRRVGVHPCRRLRVRCPRGADALPGERLRR